MNLLCLEKETGGNKLQVKAYCLVIAPQRRGSNQAQMYFDTAHIRPK